jgi:type I restriction enzyme, S subunit
MRSDLGWPRVCIADVCEAIVDCVNRTAPIVERPTPYKMIRTTNVRDGWIDLSDTKYVTEETYERWTRRQVPKRGDIVLTREAPLGEVGIIRTDEPVFLGQRLVSYRADPQKLDKHFLLYSFQERDLQAQIKALGSGATVEHMRVPDAKKLTLVLPPIDIQQRIASILSAYDDLIENNARRIAILEEMARALYQEWFVHFRFPGHEHVPLVDSPLGPIPEGWEVANFIEIADVLSGGTPKKSEPDFWGGPIPFYTPRDAPKSVYVLTTEGNITESGLRRCNSSLYPKDTVFITARGTVGRLALAATSMAMNQSCYALRGKEGVHQLFLFLATRHLVEHLQQQAHGAVFDTIIVDTFQRLKVIRSPAQVIRDFGNLVEPFFAQILLLLRKNVNLRTTRDLLLPRLISGEIDVSALPEEPVAEAAD